MNKSPLDTKTRIRRKIETALELKEAPVVFAGVWGVTANTKMPMFNLLEPIGKHPKGSTLVLKSLESLGLCPPAAEMDKARKAMGEK